MSNFIIISISKTNPIVIQAIYGMAFSDIL